MKQMTRRNQLALFLGMLIIIGTFIIIFSLFYGYLQIPDQKIEPMVMSAQQFFEDIQQIENETTKHAVIDFKSLQEGDVIIVNDTVEDISYLSNLDLTRIEFIVNTTLVSSITFDFAGNITDKYKKNDVVKITCTIKHVNFSHNGWMYDYEVFEESWDQTYYVTHFLTKPLPQTCISHSN